MEISRHSRSFYAEEEILKKKKERNISVSHNVFYFPHLRIEREIFLYLLLDRVHLAKQIRTRSTRLADMIVLDLSI